MSLAIRADGLCKRYFIGQDRPADTLAELVSSWMRAPLGWFGGQRRRWRQRRAVHALQDFSFEVNAGEVLGIIGANGAGKSTLLKILARITEPTAGRAEIHGRVGSLLEVGTGFHPELTGRENVFLNGSILGMGRQEILRNFDEIVAFAEVEPFIDTPVKFYSSGMHVRLAFAVAAHLEPEILLVDEVLAVGDASFQRKCMGKLGEVAGEQRTVLFVSHNMPAVVNLCDRALCIHGGRLVDEGAPADVVARYLSSVSRRHAESSIAATDLRSGTGEVRFSSIETVDGSGAGASTFASGSRFEVRFTLDLCTAPHVVGLDVGFTIRDPDGRALFICRSDLQQGYSNTVRAGEVLRCVVDALPLYPGAYFLTVCVRRNEEVADLLERVLEIEVVPGDFYGSGRLSTSTGAQLLVAHTWSRLP